MVDFQRIVYSDSMVLPHQDHEGKSGLGRNGYGVRDETIVVLMEDRNH